MVRPEGYWKAREQTPERKEYQHLRFKRGYMKKYRETHPNYLKYQKNYDATVRTVKRQENRKKLIELFGGKCIKCGYCKCSAALEFHHRNKKEKEMNLNQSLLFEKLVKEAKKCDLLCANCHREVHF